MGKKYQIWSILFSYPNSLSLLTMKIDGSSNLSQYIICHSNKFLTHVSNIKLKNNSYQFMNKYQIEKYFISISEWECTLARTQWFSIKFTQIGRILSFYVCYYVQACRPRGCRGCHGTPGFWHIR